MLELDPQQASKQASKRERGSVCVIARDAVGHMKTWSETRHPQAYSSKSKASTLAARPFSLQQRLFSTRRGDLKLHRKVCSGSPVVLVTPSTPFPNVDAPNPQMQQRRWRIWAVRLKTSWGLLGGVHRIQRLGVQKPFLRRPEDCLRMLRTFAEPVESQCNDLRSRGFPP